MRSWPSISGGRTIRPSHITTLQDAVDDIDVTVATDIPLAGIQGALEAYIEPDQDNPLANRVASRVLASDFGVRGNGSTDSTVYLQDAFDYAQTLVSGSTGVPMVELPPGAVVLTDEIDKKSAALVGCTTANNGTRVIWNGASGGTAFTQTTDAGGTSFGYVRDINFRPGTGEPETWLDLSAAGVDAFYQLDHLHFVGGDIQIKVGYWVNCHWEYLRFDHWHEYAIEMTPPGSQFLASFVLEKFTADHHTASGAMGHGFLHVDNSANSSSLGTIELRNARVEINAALDSPDALIVYTVPDSGPNPRSAALHLSDMSIQGVGSTPLGSLLYRDTADTFGSEMLNIDNVVCSGVTAFLGGTWPSSFPTALGTPGLVSRMSIQGTHTEIGQTQTKAAQTSATIPHVQTSRTGDAEQRFYQDFDGKMWWGGGTLTQDVNLYRSAGNLLRTDDALMLPGTYDLPLRLGDYRLWVNPGDGKLYIKSSAPSSATDGTVVGTQS